MADIAITSLRVSDIQLGDYVMVTGAGPIGIKKHILIEKPEAFTKEQIPLMLEAQKNNPELMIMDCSCRHARLQPKFQTIKKLISKGNIGKIYKIHHNFLNRQTRPGIEYQPDAKWLQIKNFLVVALYLTGGCTIYLSI